MSRVNFVEQALQDPFTRKEATNNLTVQAWIVAIPVAATLGAAAGGVANMAANGKSRDRVDERKDGGEKDHTSHHYIAECTAIGGGVGVLAGPIVARAGIRAVEREAQRAAAAPEEHV